MSDSQRYETIPKSRKKIKPIDSFFTYKTVAVPIYSSMNMPSLTDVAINNDHLIAVADGSAHKEKLLDSAK
jgi:hypothetical protein